MPGFDNKIVFASNVDFTGNSLTQGTAQIASNGQLLIGSATGTNGPCLLAGFLTSPDGSITVTNGSGTISLSVTGGGTVGKTITGNSGGALVPTLGNWNIVGAGSLTTMGTGNTLTVQVTGLTNHAVLVGSGGTTITNIAATANSGAVLQNNSGADPSYSTATYPSTTAQGDLLLSSSANTITSLAKNATATRYLANTGASNNANWDQVNLANGVTGVTPIANGGTNATSFGTTHGVVVYNGTSLVNYAGPQISTSGIATNTSQPAFFAYSASGVTNQTGDGTVITVVLDTVFFDNDSNFNTTTHEFTAPVTGTYFFTASVSRRSSGTSTTQAIYISTTARNYYAYGGMNTNGNGDGFITVSALANMTAGDVAFVNFSVTGGTKDVGYWLFSSGSGTNTSFSGYLVC